MKWLAKEGGPCPPVACSKHQCLQEATTHT
jgi:hypothetical protein